MSRSRISWAASCTTHPCTFRKCRIAPDGTRLPEDSESPDPSLKSSNSTLVIQTNAGDQKEPVLVAFDPIPESVIVH